MDRVSYRTTICGNFIALPTPFQADFSLDLPVLRRLVRRLIEAGYRRGNGVLLAGGAGGEFASLRTEERKQVAAVVVEEAAGLIPVVVGAQDTSAFRVLEITRFAEGIGAQGVQVGPSYYEPATPEDTFGLFKSVSDAASIPMVVYNTWWTGTHADMAYDQTARLLEVANIGALKWSSPNTFDYELVLRDFAHRLPIIDNQLSEIFSHMMGATGFVSHAPLAWPQYGLQLWDCLQQQRYAEALGLIKRLRIPYYRLFFKAYAYSGSEGHLDKAILQMLGEPAGPPRPPARPLPPVLLEELRQMLRDAEVPGLR